MLINKCVILDKKKETGEKHIISLILKIIDPRKNRFHRQCEKSVFLLFSLVLTVKIDLFRARYWWAFPPRQTCMSLCVLSTTLTELSIASSAIYSYLFEVRKFPNFNLLVFKSILEDKIRIHARACNILYFSRFSYVFTVVLFLLTTPCHFRLLSLHWDLFALHVVLVP